MRCRCIVVTWLVLLGAISVLWAAPFTEVPSSHWAYGACARLTVLDILPSDMGTSFTGSPQLTRFEFGTALIDPLTTVEEAVAPLAPDASTKALLNTTARAFGLSPRLSEEVISEAARDLIRLTGEFGDVLSSLDFDPARAVGALRILADSAAVREWRAEALAGPSSTLALADIPTNTNTLELPLAHGTFAFTYRHDPEAPELLDYLALSSAAARRNLSEVYAPAEPALRDPLVSRLRTAYEYGLGSAVTLSLAYEEIARRGQGLSPLDTASLASFGIGYRLTPSTSISMSYSLLEYSNYALDTPPLRDRLAETAVSIEF